MSVIKLHTENERLIFDEKPIITSGNVNVDSINVTLCGNWKQVGENADMWAVFYRNESNKLKVKIENGVCTIPSEMLEERGLFYFGVYAENEAQTQLKTSLIVEYPVRQGTPQEGCKPVSVKYEEIKTLLDENNIDGETPLEQVALIIEDFKTYFAEIEAIGDIADTTTVLGKDIVERVQNITNGYLEYQAIPNARGGDF